MYNNLKLIKTIHEKLEDSNLGLYYVPIRAIESYTTLSWRLVSLDEFGLWHDRLGYPGATIMHRIISNSRGHLLKNIKILLSKYYSCETCSQGKLIT